MNELQDHPIAKCLPEMPADEFAALVEDIGRNGVQVPIVIFEDQILDGRHRYRAAIQVGAHVPQEFYHGDDAPGYVASLNFHRRHLTASQKAAVGAELKPHYEEAARKRMLAGAAADPSKLIDEGAGRAIDKAAAAVGVNASYIQDAANIKADAPDVFEDVRAGKVSIPEAKRQVAARKPAPEPKKRGSYEAWQSFRDTCEQIKDAITRLEKLTVDADHKKQASDTAARLSKALMKVSESQ